MIELRGCVKRYRARGGGQAFQVLDSIDLVVRDREFVCLLGPSGCGKTTIIKMIAGLVLPDEGEILIDGRRVEGPGDDRAVVFQDFALLPWADVTQNVAFGLELRGVDRATRQAAAARLVRAVGLAGFEHYYPPQLSGGMQQRVGLARALAIEPRVLLMDEPFGSVDSMTRRSLQEELLRLHQDTPKTVVFVTHSVDEAVRLGDRVVRLGGRPARIEEILAVDLPRPRPREIGVNPRFIEIKEQLWNHIKLGPDPPREGEPSGDR
jgi:ABC-type nitrate/sulfonate/bicarbonate transport system ATPase subunit